MQQRMAHSAGSLSALAVAWPWLTDSMANQPAYSKKSETMQTAPATATAGLPESLMMIYWGLIARVGISTSALPCAHLLSPLCPQAQAPRLV